MHSRHAHRTEPDALEALLVEARPRLVRALIAMRGQSGAADAASEAIAWAWENGNKLIEMENPVGYLYRVALTRSAPRKTPKLPPVNTARIPEVEPGLVPALLELPEQQRSAVWLAHACDWTYGEIAEALGIGTSTVGTHVSRGLDALRVALGHDDVSKENRS